MESRPLRVLARLEAKPGKADDLRALLIGLVEPTRLEPGCSSYELLQNREDPTEFTFVGAWRDDDALGAHFQTDHVKRAFARLPDLLEGNLDVRKFDLLE